MFAGSNDAEWITWLTSRNIPYISWNPDTDTFSGFVRRLAEYDIFITARFHGALFATLLGKPSICIGVEEKLELFADLLDQGGRLWRHPFEPDACLEAVDNLRLSYARATAVLKNVAETQGRLANKMVADFTRFFQESLNR